MCRCRVHPLLLLWILGVSSHAKYESCPGWFVSIVHNEFDAYVYQEFFYIALDTVDKMKLHQAEF